MSIVLPMGGRKDDQDRRDRLAAQLRANLQKRKAQARGRRAGVGEGRDDAPASPGRTPDKGKARTSSAASGDRRGRGPARHG
ncbi:MULTISPECIES: hypothetical protein [unclassified Roseitalea]|uniref:hypothetical protein n=1 Tax=unclassified Roseitalea TaxID=2639107 RepID=UPI00273FB7AD|nr:MULTISPECIES: hypothetical protein [unclassified Roseitalea]